MTTKASVGQREYCYGVGMRANSESNTGLYICRPPQTLIFALLIVATHLVGRDAPDHFHTAIQNQTRTL
jgi:predicted cobalt transporter CbtA